MKHAIHLIPTPSGKCIRKIDINFLVQVNDTGKVSLSQILVTSGRFSKCAKINTKLLPPQESYTSASLVMNTRIEFPFLSHIRILTKLY